MKRTFLTVLAFAALATVFGAEAFHAELSADPAEFPAGSATMVSITMNRDDLKEGLSLPKLPGAVWHTDRVSMSQSHRFVNGRGEHSVTYMLPLSAETPGELTIPPLEFKLKDGRTVRSNALKLKVLAPGERAAAASGSAAAEPEGRLAVPPRARREKYYAGEEIPLELMLSIPARARVRHVDYPVLAVDGPAVFPDYSKLDKSRHPHFSAPREGVRNTSRGRERVMVLDTFVRFVEPGEFRVSAKEQLELAAPSARRRGGFDDDFFGDGLFGSFFDRGATRPFTVVYPALKFEVLPLPPRPAGAHFLDLVGDWKPSVSLSAHAARVGEPVELKVALAGGGSGDGLTPPKLELPGFRVYPPEVSKDPDSGLSIRYALIPLEPGEHKLSPRFAVFDPVSGTYRESGGTLLLAVSGSAASASVPHVSGSPPPPAAPEPAAESSPAREELFYQKAGPGKAVRLPLARNLLPGVLAFALLALAALVAEVRARRRLRSDASPETAARRRAVKELLRRLDSGEDAASVMRDGGVELLAVAAGLPEGSTASETAERIEDPELRRFLLELERSAFAPGAARSAPLSAPARRRLGRLLKRAGSWLLLLATGALCGADGYNADFDKGDYASAVSKYAASAETPGGSVHPDAWYNAGCAAFKAGDAPKARLYLERAHRLAPRDAETTENLDLVNRALLQPEVGGSDTPRKLLRSCRDALRPDECLNLALVCAGLALLGLALRRKLGYWPAALAAALTLAALGSAASQLADTYRPSRAVVIAKELELRPLPVSGTRIEARIPGGGDATVLERRGDWVRLSVNGRDGWAERSGVEAVFPGGVMW